MPDFEDDLRLAHEIADAADAVTMNRFNALDLRIETKPDLSPVTDADRAVEELVRALVLRPGPATRSSGRNSAPTAPAPAGGSSTRSTAPRTSSAACRSEQR
jgi:hypothetical protein